MDAEDVVERLRGKLIVSCQALEDELLHHTWWCPTDCWLRRRHSVYYFVWLHIVHFASWRCRFVLRSSGGACAVTVGSAITRPRLIARRFAQRLSKHWAAMCS